MPVALLTGVTGQDGRFLAELLHGHSYDVVGLTSRPAPIVAAELGVEFGFVRLIEADLRDSRALIRAVDVACPDEVYNLGGFSSSFRSMVEPVLATEVNALGVVRLLEALRQVGDGSFDGMRFMQASSAEVFGHPGESRQNERTPCQPFTPYGCTKLFAQNTVAVYRERFGLHGSSAILFNHESERRGPEFLTRKVTQAVARISVGVQNDLELGSMSARRDWGFAGDYVRAMWLMLQQPHPNDYVVATGVSHSVEEFVAAAFECAGLGDWRNFVRQSPALQRQADEHLLVGDATLARQTLGWEPTIDFDGIVQRMVAHDLRDIRLREDPNLQC